MGQRHLGGQPEEGGSTVPSAPSGPKRGLPSLVRSSTHAEPAGAAEAPPL